MIVITIYEQLILTKYVVVIILQYVLSQVIMLHTLNLHSSVCQLYLNKTERKKLSAQNTHSLLFDFPISAFFVLFFSILLINIL